MGVNPALERTVNRLIARFGQSAELLRPDEGCVDDYNVYHPGPDTEYPATVVSAAYAVELQMIAGGLMGVGDRRLFLATDGLAIEPATTDLIRIDGTVFRIVRVSPLAPDGNVIFIELPVRHDG